MWRIVIENLIPMIFMIITPVFATFVSLAMARLMKKWNLDSAVKYDDKVNELVIRAIKGVEQKSMSAVKRGGDMTPGEKKLDEAMKFVNAQLQAMKLPQKASDELSMLVESKLFDGVKAVEAKPAVVVAAS